MKDAKTAVSIDATHKAHECDDTHEDNSNTRRASRRSRLPLALLLPLAFALGICLNTRAPARAGDPVVTSLLTSILRELVQIKQELQQQNGFAVDASE